MIARRETPGSAMLSYLRRQIRERGNRRGMKPGTTHRRISAEAVRNYVPVPAKWWDDFRAVARFRGIDFIYSIEDSTSVAGIEYHIHSNLSEAEDILWAIQVLEGK